MLAAHARLFDLLAPQIALRKPILCAIEFRDAQTNRAVALQVFGGPEDSPALWMVRPTVVLVSSWFQDCACCPVAQEQLHEVVAILHD